MKRETIITYDESDYELLRKHLDDAPRPCKSCNMGVACCGCPDAREWDKQHQDIKDAGLVEALDLLWSYRDEECELRDMKSELRAMESELAKRKKELVAASLWRVIDDGSAKEIKAFK